MPNARMSVTVVAKPGLRLRPRRVWRRSRPGSSSSSQPIRNGNSLAPALRCLGALRGAQGSPWPWAPRTPCRRRSASRSQPATARPSWPGPYQPPWWRFAPNRSAVEESAPSPEQRSRGDSRCRRAALISPALQLLDEARKFPSPPTWATPRRAADLRDLVEEAFRLPAEHRGSATPPQQATNGPRRDVLNVRLRHMLIGYARVSKTGGSHSLDLQRDALGTRRRQRGQRLPRPRVRREPTGTPGDPSYVNARTSWAYPRQNELAAALRGGGVRRRSARASPTSTPSAPDSRSRLPRLITLIDPARKLLTRLSKLIVSPPLSRHFETGAHAYALHARASVTHSSDTTSASSQTERAGPTTR